MGSPEHCQGGGLYRIPADRPEKPSGPHYGRQDGERTAGEHGRAVCLHEHDRQGDGGCEPRGEKGAEHHP